MRPSAHPIASAAAAFTNGTMAPKAMRNGPTSRTSRNCRATSRPISRRKNARKPLKTPLTNGAIASPPFSPLTAPMIIEPISRRWAPSVKASRSTSLIERGGCDCSTPSSGPGSPAGCGASGTRVCESAVARLPAGDVTDTGLVRSADPGVFMRDRTHVARSTAMMIAGDSINTSATVMCPPASSPRETRNCDAVTKVTALTDP